MSIIFLYQDKEYIQLSQEDIVTRNINLPMIQYNTKVYKGITNSLDFIVRNNDRKPINLSSVQMLVRVRNVETQEILLEKAVKIVDQLAGKASLILLPEEITDWTSGYYEYNVQTTDANGVDRYLYTDVNRGTFGNFELIEGIASNLVPAINIGSDQFVDIPYGDYSILYSTGAYAGDSQAGQTNGMHTVVVYTTGFVGKFWIQVSLNNEPPLDSEWSNWPIGQGTDYYEYTTGSPNIQYFNFSLNAYWVRFQYLPSQLNTGTFDLILYKN